MRIKLSDSLFNSLSKLCERLNISWFYADYFKRKTIDREDVQMIYDSWVVSGETLTEDIAELFKECEVTK